MKLAQNAPLALSLGILDHSAEFPPLFLELTVLARAAFSARSACALSHTLRGNVDPFPRSPAENLCLLLSFLPIVGYVR